MGILNFLWHGTRDSLLMAWQVAWALVFGFAISAIVQAWVPHDRVQARLSGSGARAGRAVIWATAFGAASSSCSYAAVAIAKSLFAKGASAASALAFQFASTNIVWELGLVLWVLLGWRFALAEYVGGIVMIVLMAVALRALVSRSLERRARAHARASDPGHVHPTAASSEPWRERVTSLRAWSDVALNFRGDGQMLYREIGIGLLLSGFVAQLPSSFFHSLFLHNAPAPLPALENAIIGPIIAMLSFVCSVGNVPLAAVLWSQGISFAGVLSFLFADLIVLPIIVIYRKYYGTSFALRITGLMFVTMVLAALIVAGVFAAVGLVPDVRPTSADIFAPISLNYTFVLNVIAAGVLVALFALSARRGAKDPVCGMTVGRDVGVVERFGGSTFVFCSEGCRDAFAARSRSVRDVTHAIP